MPLNKIQKGSNMYQGWLTHTWNAIKGKCPHDCEYCYMKKWGEQPALHFDKKELKTDLGNGNFIFVGSSCDIFADAIPVKWIKDTLEHCRKFDNAYVFQSKNPRGIYDMGQYLPDLSVLGTTIETNRIYKEMCKAPIPKQRASWLSELRKEGREIFLTIEPIMQFDLDDMVKIIKGCKPNFINIGANTNSKVKLQEPWPEEVMALIERLKEFTEVKIKKNLKRLLIREHPLAELIKNQVDMPPEFNKVVDKMLDG